ncbi:hypothetical protein DFH27DRAFT_597367 [Peziza echinospora]|nr:hypothetical protein DFH27DRAFT_597367 [Peziza echinospora]
MSASRSGGGGATQDVASMEESRLRKRKEGYRPPCQIPVGLRDTLKIVLEEELYIPGFDLLHSLITQGISSESTHDHASSVPGTGTATPTVIPTTASNNSNSNNSSSTDIKASKKEHALQDGVVPVYVPPSAHLKLCTTILAHPSFTTHVSKKKDRDAGLVPPIAERLLRRLMALAGPQGMNINEAWGTFGGEGRGGSPGSLGVNGSSRGGNASRGNTPDPSAIFEDNKLDLSISRRDGLFERAEDFWAIVGWAFTCACADTAQFPSTDSEEDIKEKRKGMKKRWGAWKRVLSVMVEGLERDWEDRSVLVQDGPSLPADPDTIVVRSRSTTSTSTGTSPRPHVSRDQECAEIHSQQKNALIVKYLPKSTGNAAFRRVVRAIFADGKGKQNAEWREIWRDEVYSLKTIRGRKNKKAVPVAPTKANGRKSNTKEKKEVPKKSLLDESSSDEDEEDEDEEGDAMADVEYEEDEFKPEDGTVEWGGMEALLLRHRLLVLISDVVRHGFFCATDKFFEELKDYILPLPHAQFLLFTNPLLLPFPAPSPDSATTISTNTPFYNYHISINLTILRSLITSNAPSATSLGYDYDVLNEQLLLACYLPWAARTTNLVDNTKMAVVLQSLVRVLARYAGLRGTPEMVGAMEDGVERRKAKVGSSSTGGAGRGKPSVNRLRKDEAARRRWIEAEGRLRGLVEVLSLLG